ncbi:MAG: hypothetical protein FWG55_05935, partial [Candidatus Bathyarchaeota archaeon]|nr:hypothetical protein [Candidatus Termiticorpusculum sp.]
VGKLNFGINVYAPDGTWQHYLVTVMREGVLSVDPVYAVHYYLENTENSVYGDKLVFKPDVDDDGVVTEYPVVIAGYTIVDSTPKVVDLDNVEDVVFYYTANTDIEYTVHYYKFGTTTKVAEDKVVGGKTMNSIVTENAVNVAGYVAVNSFLTKTLVAEGNEFVFYYVEEPVSLDVEYVVHYYLQGTVLSVALDKVVYGKEEGAVVTEVAPLITGFTAVAPTSITITLNAENNVITFYYTENRPIEPSPSPSVSPSPSPSVSPSPSPSTSPSPSPSTSPSPSVSPSPSPSTSPSPSPSTSPSPSPSASPSPSGSVPSNSVSPSSSPPVNGDDETFWTMRNTGLVVAVAVVVLVLLGVVSYLFFGRRK